jgi:membrane-associated phospholipid phosphatase
VKVQPSPGIALMDRQEGDRPAVMAWPGLDHLLSSLVHTLQCALVFALVYGGADLVARLHSHRISSYLPIDDHVPLVPSATLVYSSLWLMFAIVPFVLRREHELRSLARIIRLEIVIAGAFFLLAPMPDRLPAADLGRFAVAFRAADMLNLEFNQFPSLHAAFGFTLGWMLGRACGPRGKLWLATWSLAIAAAAVVTWQHALLDIVGAAVLTAAVVAFHGRGVGDATAMHHSCG